MSQRGGAARGNREASKHDSPAPARSGPPVARTLRVQKSVYGGHGLARVGSDTVLVPGTLPGEIVDVAEIRKERGALWAVGGRVVETSADRRAAPCPYYGECGGCSLQHVGYGRQVEMKVDILRETLERIAWIQWQGPIAVARSPELGYRIRAQLKVERSEGRVVLGFYRRRSKRVCPIDRCLLLPDQLNRAIGPLARMLSGPLYRSVTAVDLLGADGGALYVRLLFDGTPPVGAAQDFLRVRGCAGVWTESSDGSTAGTAGSSRAPITVGPWTYFATPGSFFQVNGPLHSALINALDEALPKSGDLAFDLYCGVGFFTLPLAHRFERVIAVEENDRSLRLARGAASAAAGLLRGKIQFVASDAGRFLAAQNRCTAPELVVLDPPRQGLSRTASGYLVSARPKQVIYFSCEPATFARDLRVLVSDGGYEVRSIRAFDLFPQTADIEVMADLRASEGHASTERRRKRV